jgi:N-acetylneuraminic acid mutarotase
MSRRRVICNAIAVVIALGSSVGLTRPDSARAATQDISATPPPTWSTTTPTHTKRGFLAATTGLDGRIYAIGGYACGPNNDCSQTVVFLNSMEIYNPTTKVWSRGAPMHVARACLAAVTGSDGRIYAIGGGGCGFAGPGPAFATATVEAYSPKTKKWTLLAPMLTTRSSLAAVFGPDGRIYAMGGVDVTGHALSTVEAYSPTSNTWTTVAPMSTPRVGLAGVRDRFGRIYAINGNVAATAERYTISTNSWASVAPMSTTLGDMAGARGPDGRLYLFGGLDNSGFETQAAEAYDPVADAWTAIAAMPFGVAGLAAARGTDGRIYAIDGSFGFGGACCPAPTNTVQVLTI